MSGTLDSYNLEYEDTPGFHLLHRKRRGTKVSPEEKKRRKELIARRKLSRIKKAKH